MAQIKTARRLGVVLDSEIRLHQVLQNLLLHVICYLESYLSAEMVQWYRVYFPCCKMVKNYGDQTGAGEIWVI